MGKSHPSIAATSTLAMVCAAESRGVDSTDLLKRAGLTRAFLEDPDARIPAVTVLAIWDALRARTGDATLQLVAPTSLPFGAYRVIDYLVAASATVGEGVDRFARFFRLIAEVAVEIHHERDTHCLCLAAPDGGPIPPVYVDYVFAALVSRVRMKIRPQLRVLRVELRQTDPITPLPYSEVFRAPVRFHAAADRLCFSDEEWHTPIESADAALAKLMEEHARILTTRMPRAGSVFTADVQKTIAAAPPECTSAHDVARALNVSVRTLQRKLVATGTSFRQVSDTVRGQLAQEYLAGRGVSIAEVALLLGFSDQSSFNRAFRRWTGESPGRWRRRLTLA